jgi:hypothetical protein
VCGNAGVASGDEEVTGAFTQGRRRSRHDEQHGRHRQRNRLLASQNTVKKKVLFDIF